MAELESLLERLVGGRVHFVIVGGYAAVAHGVTLLTQDLDVCCEFTPDNLLRLQTAVRKLHPVHRMTPQRLPLRLTARTCRGLRHLYLDTDLGQLDCLGEVLGLGDYLAVAKQSVALALPFGACRVLTLSALMKAKKAMGRPRDLEALRQLKIIRNKIRARQPNTGHGTPP